MMSKTRLFSFHIFVDYYKSIKQIAKDERRSISQIINHAIKEFLEKRNLLS